MDSSALTTLPPTPPPPEQDNTPWKLDHEGIRLYHQASLSRRDFVGDMDVDEIDRRLTEDEVPVGAKADHVWRGAPEYATIVKRLGAGGFGATFEIMYKGKPHCLKISVNDESCREAWANEVAVLRLLSHVPGVAHIRQATFSPKRLFLILNLGELGTLRTYAFEPLSLRSIIRMAGDLADTLDRVHQHGVVHLDLKPANIVLTKGNDGLVHPLIIDWGMAAIVDRLGFCSPREASTPGYVAPEQMTGEPVSPATDTYILGLVLVEFVENSSIKDLTWSAPFPYSAHEVEALVAADRNIAAFGSRELWYRSCIWRESPLGLAFKEAVENCLDLDPEHRPPVGKLGQEFRRLLPPGRGYFEYKDKLPENIETSWCYKLPPILNYGDGWKQCMQVPSLASLSLPRRGLPVRMERRFKPYGRPLITRLLPHAIAPPIRARGANRFWQSPHSQAVAAAMQAAAGQIPAFATPMHAVAAPANRFWKPPQAAAVPTQAIASPIQASQ